MMTEEERTKEKALRLVLSRFRFFWHPSHATCANALLPLCKLCLVGGTAGQLKHNDLSRLWIALRVQRLQKGSCQIHVETLFLRVSLLSLLRPLLDETLLEEVACVAGLHSDVNASVAHAQQRQWGVNLKYALLGVHVLTCPCSRRGGRAASSSDKTASSKAEHLTTKITKAKKKPSKMVAMEFNPLRSLVFQ